jgi:aminoglycoside 6'-N-acetyltransferase
MSQPADRSGELPDVPEELRGDRVVLRRATVADLPELLPITRTPEVSRWWGPQEDLGEEIVRGEVPKLVILVGGAVAGLIQFHEEIDPQFRHAGVDLYLDPRVHGQGFGTDAVRTLARWLVTVRGHHRLIIDPDAGNDAAIRAYAKAGFKPVGIMRRYSDVHGTGEWRDGLLMDALAEEILESGARDGAPGTSGWAPGAGPASAPHAAASAPRPAAGVDTGGVEGQEHQPR